MPKPKQGVSSHNQPIHYSVGAIIRQGDKYLLIDRAQIPYGFACPAGHIDEGEDEITTLKREIEEEVGLKIKSYKLLIEEEAQNNICTKGVNIHYWRVYSCEAEGEVHRNYRETKSAGWFTMEEIRKLKLEPVWEIWFKKLKMI